ncbi:MAG: HNH endonuclease [Actinomycetota bacterium]|nr:HNH endonuclease [Actinomycetota bacterium]
MPKQESAKDRIKGFFRANVGQVVTAAQVQEVARPVSEWARRVRELRDDEGWPIITNNDSAVLKPGEYLLVGEPPERRGRSSQRTGLSQRLRAEVLIRDGYTCQMCGACAGEMDPETGRKVRLHIKRIGDESSTEPDERSNFETVCSTCNQGAKKVDVASSTEISIKTEIKKASPTVQRSIYEWLKQTLEDQPIHRL